VFTVTSVSTLHNDCSLHGAAASKTRQWRNVFSRYTIPVTWPTRKNARIERGLTNDLRRRICVNHHSRFINQANCEEDTFSTHY